MSLVYIMLGDAGCVGPNSKSRVLDEVPKGSNLIIGDIIIYLKQCRIC